MANDGLFELLQLEWNGALTPTESPEAFSIHQRPPGRYALFAMLEQPLEILQEMRDTGLLYSFANRFINTSWSVRELVVHLAGWAKELRREVEILAAEQGFDYSIPFGLSVLGPTEWNRNELEKRRAIDIDAACAEYERETLLLQDLVLDLPQSALYRTAETPFAPSGDPAARWRASIAAVITAQTSHFGYHLNQLRTRLKRY